MGIFVFIGFAHIQALVDEITLIFALLILNEGE
jgi:hypothetical protein